jgi:hypothetical protein
MAVNVRKTLPFTATFSIQSCLFVAAMRAVREPSEAAGLRVAAAERFRAARVRIDRGRLLMQIVHTARPRMW